MVQMANLGKIRQRFEAPTKAAPPPVKLEVEDPLEEDRRPLCKKTKVSAPFQQWGTDTGIAPQQSTPYSLLEEPSPLGLRLRKSPSLLDLIQMRLSEGNSATASHVTGNGGSDAGKKKDMKSTAVSGTTDKLKASNFPVSLLRIGSWECVSRYEGDLVGKCYYAKHKLVWEVLDGGLKSKIEIQWSDITALKATCSENSPGTLDLVLARQPLFFRETNPQPRKHTLWQATSDFTNGQASMHRRHFLQCPPGLLGKHFEKLIQCDPRLNSLSQQPEIILEFPYFDPRCSVFEDHEESKCHGFDDMKDGFGAAPSTSSQNDTRVPISRTPDNVTRETLSPSSVMDTRIIDENPATSSTTKEEPTDPIHWDQIKVPGLRSSMSVTDLVNHLGHCIAGQTTPGNPLLPADSSLNKSTLEELTQYLLSDSQVVSASASDEKFLTSRVNSLCCLIQHKDDDNGLNDEKPLVHESVEPQGISRKESYGELLMHLPRIASLPQFLFDITDDAENQSG